MVTHSLICLSVRLWHVRLLTLDLLLAFYHPSKDFILLAHMTVPLLESPHY